MGMSLNKPTTMAGGLLGRTQIYPKVASCCCAVECVGQTKKHIKLAYYTLHYHDSITTLLYFGTAVMPKIWENFSCVFITLHYLGRHYSTLLYLGLWDFGDKLGEKVVSPGRRRLLGM